MSVDAHYRDVSLERKGLFEENDDIKSEWALIIRYVYIRYKTAPFTPAKNKKGAMGSFISIYLLNHSLNT